MAFPYDDTLPHEFHFRSCTAAPHGNVLSTGDLQHTGGDTPFRIYDEDPRSAVRFVTGSRDFTEGTTGEGTRLALIGRHHRRTVQYGLSLSMEASLGHGVGVLKWVILATGAGHSSPQSLSAARK